MFRAKYHEKVAKIKNLPQLQEAKVLFVKKKPKRSQMWIYTNTGVLPNHDWL
jgi:hypothetical protein